MENWARYINTKRGRITPNVLESSVPLASPKKLHDPRKINEHYVTHYKTIISSRFIRLIINININSFLIPHCVVMEVTEVTCKAGLHKQNGRHWQNSVKTTLGNELHCFKRVILD